MTYVAPKRVVAGMDPSGHSRVLADDVPAMVVELLPNLTTAEIWDTAGPWVDLDDLAVQAPAEVRFPPPGGSVFRILEFRKKHDGRDADEQSMLQELMAGDVGSVRGHLHKTRSTDYFVVLKGQIQLHLETETVTLKQGDAVVCLGVNHAWECVEDQPARLFAVLIGSENFAPGPVLDPPEDTFLSSPSQTEGISMSTSRRVVAGLNAAGQSTVVLDGYMPQPAGREGVVWSKELWRTLGEFPDNQLSEDLARTTFALPPTDGGSVFWLVEMPPGDASSREGYEHLVGEAFAESDDSSRRATGGLHGHDSLIYIAVLSGSIVYITENDEIELHDGDTLVQLGNAHSWRNDTSDPCIVGIVMIDAPRGRAV